MQLAVKCMLFIMCIARGGWKCGYITCAILHRLRILYERNVNDVPSLAYHRMHGEILRWLEIYTPTLFQVSKFSVLKTKTYRTIGFRPPSWRKNASTCNVAT